MSAKKFKFVSPGVFLSEIDQSQLPKAPGAVGPVVIGRTRRGPALKPVKVNSFQEFVEIFGEPIPGNEGEDPWRDGNGLLAPAYAPLAAQAYLKAEIDSPVTVVRLLGVQGDDASDNGQPGWDVQHAMGLFVMPSSSLPHNEVAVTASLVGIVYTTEDSFEFGVKGQAINQGHTTASLAKADATNFGAVKPVKVTNHLFTVSLKRAADTSTLEKQVSFRDGIKYIRDELNTNPTTTNDQITEPTDGSRANKYWLGETFEEEYERVVRENPGKDLFVFATRLATGMDDFKSANHGLTAAKSGWVIPQYNGTNTAYDPTKLERLFRVVALDEGEQGSDLNIKIENIRISLPGEPSPFGRFDVVVEQKRGGRILTVESFSGLNLNPNSDNFIARRIGDQFFEWSVAEKRNKVYGNYPNQSSYIRVEMEPDVGENGPTNQRSVPFGFLGPIVPKPVSGSTTAGTASFNSGWVGAGSVKIGASNQRMFLRWPQVPHVVSSSVRPDLDGNYALGGTQYNKTTAVDGTINFSSVNNGMRDFLRRGSSWSNGSVYSTQDTGIATGDTEHSYIFSLDEVVVTGSTNLSNSMASFSPTMVQFRSGSHRGGDPSTVSFTFSTSVPGNATLTLISTDQTSKTYIAKDDDGAANGTLDGNNVVFRRGSHASAETRVAFVASSLKAAIESANGHAGKLKVTISETEGQITITQTLGGSAGDTAIVQGSNFSNAVSTSPFPTALAGGGQHTAFTAHVEAGTQLSASALLELVDGFAMPMVGGFDGVNIVEADPFNMRASTATLPTAGPDATTRNSYAYASVDRAIELVRDPEALEMNIATIPGITNPELTRKLVQVCEARADALAIIDLPDIYIPPQQSRCTNFRDRVNKTTPAKSAKALKARQLNSSYGAAYYPWVKVRDTVNSRDVWAPPSVVALGVMGYTEQKSEVWFAPAGFNRGGLNEGNAGIPVLQASEQLLSSQRDTLYEANINPIASFVSEGLVVFGQKTLQMTPSALDRINVRRLLIFVKKEVSRIANGLLFDQNLPATWNRFTGQVVPFLESVKTRLGLTDFKVVLDRTTTTPDLVDRNILYAKIFLKPARAIEFIAVDFVITRSGASFED